MPQLTHRDILRFASLCTGGVALARRAQEKGPRPGPVPAAHWGSAMARGDTVMSTVVPLREPR